MRKYVKAHKFSSSHRTQKRNVLCPVCESHRFRVENDFAICPVCGWENDGVQMSNHDYWGGANKLTVNESKIFYELSKCPEKKNVLNSIIDRHRDLRIALNKKYSHINWMIDGREASAEYRKEHDRYFSELLLLFQKK